MTIIYPWDPPYCATIRGRIGPKSDPESFGIYGQGVYGVAIFGQYGT